MTNKNSANEKQQYVIKHVKEINIEKKNNKQNLILKMEQNHPEKEFLCNE